MPGAEVHPEVLDGGLAFGIDDGTVQRRFGNLKIGFGQQGRQLQRVLVVHESVFGDRVRGKARGQIVVEQQQFAERVPILRDGQAPDEAVLRRRTQAGNFQRVSDPLDHALAVGAGRLRQALRRHGPRADPVPDGFPSRNMPVLELGVELVHPDARGARIRVVASDAVLLKEWLHVLFERGFERRWGRQPPGPAGNAPSPRFPRRKAKSKPVLIAAESDILECTDRISNHITISLNYAQRRRLPITIRRSSATLHACAMQPPLRCGASPSNTSGICPTPSSAMYRRSSASQRDACSTRFRRSPIDLEVTR